mmetsp:Transcript_76982/g.213989  ORF Transcript_76982/g.213989 Transcript_76982/m.213989 type:complete len:341 (-) Transcript_76982:109-1131(-)
MSQVRTLFIGGLPRDCTERELHLLFYEGGGCEAIRLRQTTAFVQFATRERALEAATNVNGMVYDPADPAALLRVEMAKQDFKSIPQPMVVAPPHVNADTAPITFAGVKRPRENPSPMTPVQQYQQHKDLSTIFMGSLGESCTRADVEEYAGSQEGLVALVMKQEGTSKATAWAQYATPEQAAMALANLSQLPLMAIGKVPNLEAAKTDTNSVPRSQQLVAPRNVVLPPTHTMRASPMHVSPLAHVMTIAAPDASTTSSTVFLGSLEPQVTEEEIQSLVLSMEGFVRLTCKSLGQPRATAWAQYVSPAAASAACSHLQQMLVPSMGRVANVELAKSDIRRP